MSLLQRLQFLRCTRHRCTAGLRRFGVCSLLVQKQLALATLFFNTPVTELAHARDLCQNRPVERGVSIGLGDNFQTDLAGGNVRENVTFLSVMLSRGKVFRELDRGRSIQFAVEGSVSLAKQQEHSRLAVGAAPLFLYSFKTAGEITAYTEAGLGLLYTNLDPERFGSRMNFTVHVGIGLRYRLTNGRFLRVSYRLHHISNAGLDDANKGIDSNFLTFGISFLR